jgi:hypothetical protein
VPLSPAWIKDPDRAFFAESQDLIVRGFSYLCRFNREAALRLSGDQRT